MEDRKYFLYPALSVSIGHSHSISRHRPRKPSQKFNMCDFVARSQAFVAKAVIACDHWCPYIVRHRALLCVLLTHIWKPGITTNECVLYYMISVFSQIAKYRIEKTTLTRTFFIHFLGNFHPCGSAFNDLKPGFHTCVSRTHNSARCLKMYGHQ